MPLRNGYIYTYPLPAAGLNISKDLLSLHADESPWMKNCYYREGIQMRKGSRSHTVNPLSTSDPGNTFTSSLHRYYYDTASRWLFAAEGNSVTKSGGIYKFDEAARTWLLTMSGRNTENVNFVDWAPVNSVYISDGVNRTIKFSGINNWTTLSGSQANLGIRQIIPILDRLVCIDTVNPSFIKWCEPYNDALWTSGHDLAKVGGPGIIEGMAQYGLLTFEGYQDKLLFMKSSSIWLFTAKDLTLATFDARLDMVTNGIGCVAWKTAKSTPIGTIFLGTDRQVYLLDLDLGLKTIGTKIRSNREDVQGIEAIPQGSMARSHAVYHDGFYKLFVPGPGANGPNTQYWLDVDNFQKDYAGLYGPWYGPMTGQNIFTTAIQNGPSDGGELIGGEGLPTVGSYVYQLDAGGTDAVGTSGADINMQYHSQHNDHNRAEMYKSIKQVDIQENRPGGTINLVLADIDNVAVSGLSMAPTSGIQSERSQIIPGERFISRNISVQFDYTSGGDLLSIYKFSVEGQLKSRKSFTGTRSRE